MSDPIVAVERYCTGPSWSTAGPPGGVEWNFEESQVIARLGE